MLPSCPISWFRRWSSFVETYFRLDTLSIHTGPQLPLRLFDWYPGLVMPLATVITWQWLSLVPGVTPWWYHTLVALLGNYCKDDCLLLSPLGTWLLWTISKAYTQVHTGCASTYLGILCYRGRPSRTVRDIPRGVNCSTGPFNVISSWWSYGYWLLPAIEAILINGETMIISAIS